MGDDIPRLVNLNNPRPFKAEERALLDFVLAGPEASAELRAQADVALVVGVCDCGCRSVAIGLDSAAAASNGDTADDAVAGLGDYIALKAEGRSPEGTDVEVTLHVVFGRMTELEIWDGFLTQGKSKGELPDPGTLRHVEP